MGAEVDVTRGETEARSRASGSHNKALAELGGDQEPCVTFLVSLLLMPDAACRDSTLRMGLWKPQCVRGLQNTPPRLASFPTAPPLERSVGRAAPAGALRVAQRFPDVLRSLFSGNPAAGAEINK